MKTKADRFDKASSLFKDGIITTEEFRKEVFNIFDYKPEEDLLSLPERKENFRLTLLPFIEKYGANMINRFYKHWTETTVKGTRMRFEKQDTWSLAGRLATWSKRSESYSIANMVNKGKLDATR